MYAEKDAFSEEMYAVQKQYVKGHIVIAMGCLNVKIGSVHILLGNMNNSGGRFAIVSNFHHVVISYVAISSRLVVVL